MSDRLATRRAGRGRAQELLGSVLLVLAIILSMMLLIAVALPYVTSSSSTSVAAVGGSFRLVDGKGQVVTDRSWPGKFLLVYFGYTNCPDTCPTTLANIAGALTALGAKADRIQPLFITVDPERDTPAVLKRYTALFSPRIAGLTGTTAALTEAAQEYGVRYARQQTGPAPGDYEMEHSAYIYLMTPGGQLAVTIPPAQTARAMAADIAGRLQ